MSARDHKTAKIGVELLPLEVGYLPEFFRKKGEDELNYTPTVRERSLCQLKEAIAKDSTLGNFQFTDESLLLTLSSRKFDIHRTVTQIKKFMKFKNDNIYIFIDLKFEALSLISTDVLFPLPWRCQDGCVITILRPGNFDLEKHSMLALKQMFVVIITQTLRDPMTEVNGLKIIFDLNMSPQHLKICTPQNLHLLYNGAVKIMPCRIKGYHVVNMGITGRTVYHIMKVFLSDKVKTRLHVHKTIDSLLDFFPRAILPITLGGDLKDYDTKKWLRKMTTPEELAVLDILSN